MLQLSKMLKSLSTRFLTGYLAMRSLLKAYGKILRPRTLWLTMLGLMLILRSALALEHDDS